jgi:hypothetical protein
MTTIGRRGLTFARARPSGEAPAGGDHAGAPMPPKGEVGNIALNTKGAIADLKNQGYHLARIFTKLAPNA